MELCIVILNYKTPNLVLDCLDTLHGQVDGESRRVIVVDNNSPDNSESAITQGIESRQYGGWVDFLKSKENGGFAAGNNLGAGAITASNYLLLNSDTLVRPGTISTLLETLRQNPRAGIVGPRLEWPDGTPQISCFRDHSPWSEIIDAAGLGPVTRMLNQWDVPLPVSDEIEYPEWLSFACALIRADVWHALAGLDDRFFMYFEDADFCRRARKAGWKIAYQPAAKVVHLRGGSSNVKADLARRKRPPRYLYASRAHYFRKHLGLAGLVMANLAWELGHAISLVRKLIDGRSPSACDRQWIDNWINTIPEKK